MLYPLSYGSNHWTFGPIRGVENSSAQPQHNISEKCFVIRDTSPPFKHARTGS
jgi:hypothetical protein